MSTLATHINTAPVRRKRTPRVDASTIWPIRNEDDYNRAAAVVSDLALYPEGTLSEKDQARLDIFTELIAAYDAQHATPFLSGASVLDMLRFIMEQNGMSESDLGRLLGNRQSGHDIMSGKRELSKRHIRILSERFHLSPAAFL